MKLLAALCLFASLSFAELTVNVEPTYRIFSVLPDGRISSEPQHGVMVRFCSNDPATVAFTAEVSYVSEGSQVLQYVNVLAMANSSKCGVTFAWVGKVKEAHAGAWEITGMGKRADSPR
jgi:hypothetical protein